MHKFLICCLLISCALSFRFFDSSPFKKVTSKFGDIRWHRSTPDYEEIIDEGESLNNGSEYEAAFSTILDVSQNPERQKEFLECSKGKHSEFFKMGARYVGYIGNQSDHESILIERLPDDCFQTVRVNFTNKKHNANNTIQVDIYASHRRKEFCGESYMIGTGAKFNHQAFTLRKHHRFVWKNMNEVQYKNVVEYGIHIFRLCDTIIHWFGDVFKTAEVFVGGLGKNPKIPFFGSKPPKYMQEMAVNFIEAGTNFRWKERKPKFLNLTSDEVRPGDFLAVTRFDGLDQIIQYGAGSHAGHSALILEVDGVLSVVESTDGWYWPKRGIQRNDWETWKRWALNADFNVAVLPLTEESRQKFDLKKAEEFFKSMQGLPYGYHNFLFGWIDTPRDNYPPVLDPELILPLFAYLQRIYEFPINRILTQPLNKRLGVENRKLDEIAVLLAERGISMGDVMAMPQKDGWVYSDGQSYVCSAFVAAVYRAGGLLVDIEGTEMTPKDVYTLTIFNRNFKVPEKCKQNDPSLPYCQIMGSYLMQLPGYSTIEQYPHMCERCPTLTPDFFRPEGC